MLFLAPTGAQAANTGGYESGESAVYEEKAVSHPPLEYLCSLISLASYSDRIGLVARESLADNGWVLQPYREDTEKVAALLSKARAAGGGAVHALVGAAAEILLQRHIGDHVPMLYAYLNSLGGRGGDRRDRIPAP